MYKYVPNNMNYNFLPRYINNNVSESRYWWCNLTSSVKHKTIFLVLYNCLGEIKIYALSKNLIKTCYTCKIQGAYYIVSNSNTEHSRQNWTCYNGHTFPFFYVAFDPEERPIWLNGLLVW